MRIRERGPSGKERREEGRRKGGRRKGQEEGRREEGRTKEGRREGGGKTDSTGYYRQSMIQLVTKSLVLSFTIQRRLPWF